MSEVQYLEMPQGPQGGGKFAFLRGRGGLGAALALVLLLLVGGLWWLAAGKVASVYALVDGDVAMVSPRVSGTLAEIFVSEGDHVQAGQAVGRMDMSAYGRHLQQAGREIAALRAPGMEEMAGRVRQAQEAERDMVTRLAQARHEEEVRKQIRDEAVMAHVQAQLAMRGLQSQTNAKLGNRYAEAQRAEQAARQRMEQAKADFEQVSRVRAAISGELQRVRDEIMLAKQLEARQRFAPYRDRPAGQAPRMASAPQVVDGTLYAPVSGRVLKSRVAAGQAVQGGGAVLLLVPDQTGDTPGLWAQAFFPLEYSDRLRNGQSVKVFAKNGGASASGKIEALGQPQALPGSTGGAMFLPVRVALSGTPEGFSPGELVDCVAKTRSLLGFSGF